MVTFLQLVTVKIDPKTESINTRIGIICTDLLLRDSDIGHRDAIHRDWVVTRPSSEDPAETLASGWRTGAVFYGPYSRLAKKVSRVAMM